MTINQLADMIAEIAGICIVKKHVPVFERLRDVSRLLPAGTGGVDILVYTPEEFTTMRQEGNAFAEMIAEEAQVIYDQPTAS